MRYMNFLSLFHTLWSLIQSTLEKEVQGQYEVSNDKKSINNQQQYYYRRISMKYDYLIVGSGLFGSIITYEMTKIGKNAL